MCWMTAIVKVELDPRNREAHARLRRVYLAGFGIRNLVRGSPSFARYR